MKIKRTQAVALMLSLGQEKASEWDDEKLISKLRMVPTKVEADKVGDKFIKDYNNLSSIDEGDEIELLVDEGGEDGAKAEKNGKPKKDKAPKEEKGGKKEKKDKPAKKEKKPKKEKKVKAPKEETERDAFGCAKGTNRYQVNSKLTEEFQSDEEIAKAAGVTLKQARIRLRRARRDGLVEAQTLIQYKLTPSALKKIKSA